VTLSLRRVSLAASLYFLFCALVCGAQTVNVNQIRPSTTNTQVITTVGGATVWAPAPGGIPSAQGTAPIQVNGASGVPATGAITVACPTCGAAGLVSQVVVPVPTTQTVNVNATVNVPHSVGVNIASSSNTSGQITAPACNASSPPCGSLDATNITWSGFTLPSGVSASDVTNVVAYVSASVLQPGAGPIGSCTDPVGGGSADFSFPSSVEVGGGDIIVPDAQFTQAFSAAVPGADISSITCTIRYHPIDSNGPIVLNVDQINLIVTYTGTAVPNPTTISVAPALTLNTASNILGFNWLYDFGFSGGSADAYTLSLSSLVVSLTNPNLFPAIGTKVRFIPNFNNTTTSPSFNLNNSGAVAITKGPGHTALAAGDINTTNIADIEFDGTNWELQNPQTSSGGGSGSVNVNGSAVTNPNFNGAMPAAPSGSTNCTWAVSGSSVSCSVPTSSGSAITALTEDVTASGTGSVAATAVNLPGHIALTGTPSAGQVPTATSPTAATWQTPSSGGGLPFQYVYRQNCATGGTTLFTWVKYSTSGDSACVVSAATSDAQTGVGNVPLIGIAQSGAGTSGFVKIAVSGTAMCQFDTGGAVTQGALVNISAVTGGDCSATGGSAGPTNEDPESNIFYATADQAGASGAITPVDLSALVGNYGNYNAIAAEGPGTLTLLASANNGGQFAVPSTLMQSGPTPGGHGNPTSGPVFLLPIVPFHFPYFDTSFFTALGQSALGVSGNDFLLDLLTNAEGAPPGIMFRKNGSDYNVPNIQTAVSGTWSVGGSGLFAVNNSGGVYIGTLAGNATIPTPQGDNAGHVLYFEVIQAASGGPFTLTYPSNFLNVPTVSATAGAATMFSVLFDGTNYNCVAGCAGSGDGGAVSSVFGRTGAVTSNTGDYTFAQVTGAAPLASPTFTGIPAAPTAAALTNTTQLATTAFVTAALAAAGSAAGIVTYSGPSLTFTGTAFFPIGGGGLSSTTETNVDLAAPASATVKNFTVQLSAAPGTGNSIAFTWRDNATSTAITCTVSGSATACSDLTHSFTAAAGDLLDIQAVTAGTILSASTAVMGTQVGIATSGGGSGGSIETHTAASVSSLTFSAGYTTAVNAGTFNNYRIEFTNIIPSAATGTLNLVCSSNGGTSFDTGANYANSILAWSSSGTGSGGSGGGASSIQIFPFSGRTMSNASGFSLFGEMTIFLPGGSGDKVFIGEMSGPDSVTSFGQRTEFTSNYGNAICNAFQVSISSGTFTGTISAYGVPK
jgi:hypothetical protein